MLHVVPTTAMDAPSPSPLPQSKLTKKQAHLVNTIQKYGAARAKAKALRALIKELIGTFSSFQEFRRHCIDDMRAAYFEDRQIRLEHPETTVRIAEERKIAWKTAFRLLAKEQGLTGCDVDIFAIDGNRSGFYGVVLIGKEDPWWKWVRAGKRYGIGESMLVPLRKNQGQGEASPKEPPAATDSETALSDVRPAAGQDVASSEEGAPMIVAACGPSVGERASGPKEAAKSALPAIVAPVLGTAVQAATIASLCESHPAKSFAVQAVGREAAEATLPHGDSGGKDLDHHSGQPEPNASDHGRRKVLQRERRPIAMDLLVTGSEDRASLPRLVPGGANIGQAIAPTLAQVA